MNRYLLDTPLLSAYLLDRDAALQMITPWIRAQEAATSVLVYAEVNEYIRGRSDYAQRHADLLDLLTDIMPLTLTYPILQRYGELRRHLRRTNSLIGDIDTLIASTALEAGLTVVTADEDFRRVPGLTVIVLPRDRLRRRPINS